MGKKFCGCLGVQSYFEVASMPCEPSANLSRGAVVFSVVGPQIFAGAAQGQGNGGTAFNGGGGGIISGGVITPNGNGGEYIGGGQIIPGNGNGGHIGNGGNGGTNGGNGNGMSAECVCPPGPAGPQGPTGPRGIQGQQGTQGGIGPIGPTDPTGPTGERGPQGEMGPQGEIGPQGLVGERGPAGETGPKGERGEVGPVGPAGTSEKIAISGAYSLESGQPPRVTDNFDGNTHSLSFYIPKGERGEAGAAASSPIGLVEYIVSEELANSHYTDLQVEVLEPTNSRALTVATNEITVNERGLYYVSLQGYMDATEGSNETVEIIIEKNGRELPETQVACLKGQFISFNRGTFLTLNQNDKLQIKHEGTERGGSTSDLYITFIKIDL